MNGYCETIVMKFWCIFTLSWMLLSAQHAFAQITVSGMVTDPAHEPLAHVNIGIMGGNNGTVSDAHGRFRLSIPDSHSRDTLRFSIGGYRAYLIPVSSLENGRELSLKLDRTLTELKPVKVSASRLRERNFGKGRFAPVVQFSDGSIVQNDIFEIGKLVRLGSGTARITSVSLQIHESRADSGTFRIRFYRYNGSGPAEALLDTEIVQRKSIREGWLNFDVSGHAVRLRGDIVAAIEFLPEQVTSPPISYGIVPGGSGSYVRQHSQAYWTTPPHRYRMFVTALVPEASTSRAAEQDDEREPVPAFSTWSEAVRDSFRIFVRLPPGYAMSARQYPVVYLLDANFYFEAFNTAILKAGLKDLIVVGVGYRDFLQMDSLRNRDYTYPQALPEDSFPVSGGAERFLGFLRSELVPLIDSRYRSDSTDRSLMGHSLGGYFTLYALSREAGSGPAFSRYIAASPSLHYHDRYLLTEAEGLRSAVSSNSGSLFITIGSFEDAEDGSAGAQLRMLDSAAAMLRSTLPGFKVRTKIYPRQTHMQTGIPSFIDGLKYR